MAACHSGLYSFCNFENIIMLACDRFLLPYFPTRNCMGGGGGGGGGSGFGNCLDKLQLFHSNKLKNKKYLGSFNSCLVHS